VAGREVAPAAPPEFDACPPKEKFSRVDAARGLRLTAEYIEQSTDGSPALRAFLRNEGRLPIWINARMHIANKMGIDRELWLERPNHGAQVGSNCRMRYGLSARDYVFLEPGAEISQIESLHCFIEQGPATTAVVVHYQDSRSCPLIDEGEWFTGELVSDPILVGPPRNP
jgi:hypothetical protein